MTIRFEILQGWSPHNNLRVSNVTSSNHRYSSDRFRALGQFQLESKDWAVVLPVIFLRSKNVSKVPICASKVIELIRPWINASGDIFGSQLVSQVFSLLPRARQLIWTEVRGRPQKDFSVRAIRGLQVGRGCGNISGKFRELLSASLSMSSSKVSPSFRGIPFQAISR